MNGAASLWQEAKAADGRTYYYHTQTKATQWTKPAEMMGAAERATAWKEYSHDGRKYWHNPATNQTTWEMPQELRGAMPPPVQTPISAQAPQFVSGGHNQLDVYRPRDADRYNDRDRFEPVVRGPAMTSNEPQFDTAEAAEASFFKVLRKAGVQPGWTFEECIKACVLDPAYRSIKLPQERKIAFEKYVAQVRAHAKDQEKNRQAKLRADFFTMLKSHPEIVHYTRWKTALPVLKHEAVFRSARSEEEAQAIFNEYRHGLIVAHNEQEAVMRKLGLEKLSSLMKELDLEYSTKWKDAQEIIRSAPDFQADDSMQSLAKLDVLKTFEEHIKSLERVFNDKRQKHKAQKFRRERQNRDGFISLLNELRSAGKIKAGSKWADVYPELKDDPRYVAILGQATGSTPMDLFRDILEEEDQAMRAKRNDVLDVLDDKRYEITKETSWDQFLDVMKTDRRTDSVDDGVMRIIFDRLKEKVRKRSDEDRQNQRKAIDALRYRIKRLMPPVSLTDDWEQVRPRLENLSEFQVLESDDLRRQAFDKFVKRSKEREEERERDVDRSVRSRDRDRDRERERDRDRGDRYHRSSRGDSHRPRHRTRTPEIDAYEADRKKAQADRERQHRKGSFGLSPPRRSRDREERYERDRGDRYDGRSRHADHYERERRDREVERERSYVSRADPRDAANAELDYGDSRPTNMRRRRASEVSERATKRARADDGSEPMDTTPVAAATETAPDPEIAYKSGSEEGEIEEE